MRKRKFDEVSILMDYRNGLSLKDIINKYNISSINNLKKIIERNNREHIISNKKYNVDENYFETIDSEEKSYWLGFLFADGCVRLHKSRSGELRLKLSKKDEEHLKLFNKCLKSEYKIKSNISKVRYKDGIYINKKIYEQLDSNEYYTSISENVSISIYNTKMVNDLIDKGCMNKKTYKIRFPEELKRELKPHFLRGYFDGDGCVCKNKKNTFSVTITSNYNFINDIQQYLLENDILSTIYKRHNSFNCTIRKREDIIKFKNLIYQNDNIYLTRKKIIFDSI